MTVPELDKIALSFRRKNETVRKRVADAVSFLKSDKEALGMFFELAELLRGIQDMRRLLGPENDMFKEFAVPADRRGVEICGRLIGKTSENTSLFIAMSDMAMAYANRGRKPERPERKIRHKEK